MNNLLLSPLLKWVGGKRQLLSDIIPMIDNKCSTYVEPFIGGGAVLFSMQPKKAIINDYNHELINVYRVVIILMNCWSYFIFIRLITPPSITMKLELGIVVSI